MSALQRFFGLSCIVALIAAACAFSPAHAFSPGDVLVVAAVGALVHDVEPVYATLQDTCRRFGCGMSKLYEVIGAGKIEARKWGKRVLVNQASAKEYFDALPPANIKPSARDRRRSEQQKTAS